MSCWESAAAAGAPAPQAPPVKSGIVMAREKVKMMPEIKRKGHAGGNIVVGVKGVVSGEHRGRCCIGSIQTQEK